MAAMTSDQLKTFIKEQTAPLIKDTCGPLIAEVVAQQMEKALAGLKGAGNPIPGATDPVKTIIEPIKRDPGIAFARTVRAYMLARQEGTGLQGQLEQLKRWGDHDMVQTITESRAKALAAGSATAGGYMVPEQFSADIIPLRRAFTVVRKAGCRTVPLPTGTLNIPKITAGAQGSYIGENTNAPKTQPVLGNVQLTTKKLAVLVPVSNDLIRMASPAADAMVRDDIVRALAVTEDAAFLRGDGTGGQPKGLRYQCPTANINQSAGTSLANMTTDLGQCLVTLMNNNVPMINWQWVFAPRTFKALFTVLNANGFYVFQNEMAVNKTLWGYPFSISTSIPINLSVAASTTASELYLVNFDDMTIGDNLTLTIDVSQEAAYNDGSGTIIPTFQQDQSVIRAIAEHDFAARDSNAITIVNGVNWS